MHGACFSTGQLAALFDRSPATIRRYESNGIIPPANRDPVSRRRFWTQAQVDLIRRQLQSIVVDAQPTSDGSRDR